MFEDITNKKQEYFVDVLLKITPKSEKVFLSLLGEHTYADIIEKLETYIMLPVEEYNELKTGGIMKNVGDTVKLKSGGPVMTIREMDDIQSDKTTKIPFSICKCQWFVDNNLYDGKFDSRMLS